MYFENKNERNVNKLIEYCLAEAVVSQVDNRFVYAEHAGVGAVEGG